MTLVHDSARFAEYDHSLIRLTVPFDITVFTPEGVELLTDIGSVGRGSATLQAVVKPPAWGVRRVG